MRSGAGSENSISITPLLPASFLCSLIQKRRSFFKDRLFGKEIGLIQVNLERKPGVEVDLPIGTAIATATTESAEPAGYTSGLSETRGRHIANRRSEVYVVQNILNV